MLQTVAIVISEPFFFQGPIFSLILLLSDGKSLRLKQKKFIFTWYSVTSSWEIKIGQFNFLAEIIGRFLGAGPLN